VLEPYNAKVLRTVLRGLGASNRAWLLGGCVASWGQDHLAGNGADFPLARNGPEVLPGLQAIWKNAKRRLYDREAIPPRKMN